MRVVRHQKGGASSSKTARRGRQEWRASRHQFVQTPEATDGEQPTTKRRPKMRRVVHTLTKCAYLLIEDEERTGLLADERKGEVGAPDLTLVAETVLTDELELGIKTSLVVRTTRGLDSFVLNKVALAHLQSVPRRMRAKCTAASDECRPPVQERRVRKGVRRNGGKFMLVSVVTQPENTHAVLHNRTFAAHEEIGITLKATLEQRRRTTGQGRRGKAFVNNPSHKSLLTFLKRSVKHYLYVSG